MQMYYIYVFDIVHFLSTVDYLSIHFNKKDNNK